MYYHHQCYSTKSSCSYAFWGYMIQSTPEISPPSLSNHKNWCKNFPNIQYFYLLPPWTMVTNCSKKLWCYIRVWFYFYCSYFTSSWHKKGILHFKWILLWKIVLSDPMVYFAYVHSIMSYGIILGGIQPHSEKIFKIQKRVIRIITNSRARDL